MSSLSILHTPFLKYCVQSGQCSQSVQCLQKAFKALTSHERATLSLEGMANFKERKSPWKGIPMRSICPAHETPHWLGNAMNPMSDELRFIYTPLEVARREVWKRWNDRKLKGRIDALFQHEWPDFLLDGPKAILARNIATPNMELIHFFDLAESSALPPVVLEYTEDRFTPKNQEKYFLGKLFFYGGRGRKGGQKLSALRVIDFNAAHGKRLSQIHTEEGEPLPAFHHRILSRILPGAEKSMVDMSSWVIENGNKASTFYARYLSFFICHGVLFENFILQYEEEVFTREVVIPAIVQLETLLGVKPLIVPLCPFANENDPYWKYYPEEAERVVSENLKNDGLPKSIRKTFSSETRTSRRGQDVLLRSVEGQS